MAAVAALTVTTGLTPATAAPTADRGADVTRTAYQNPVSRTFADTFADPAVIRGKDGYWYSYGTTDPLREGEGTPHQIPIARSTDLVQWTYLGDAFSDATTPSWTDRAGNGAIWAPDVRYVDGEYRMYCVCAA